MLLYATVFFLNSFTVGACQGMAWGGRGPSPKTIPWPPVAHKIYVKGRKAETAKNSVRLF